MFVYVIKMKTLENEGSDKRQKQTLRSSLPPVPPVPPSLLK